MKKLKRKTSCTLMKKKRMIRPNKQSKKFKLQGSRRRTGPARSDPNMKRYLNKKYRKKNLIPKIKEYEKPPSYITPSTITIAGSFQIPSQVPIISKTDAIIGKSIFIYVDRNLESSKLIEKTLNFEQVKPSEIQSLFISKCRVCCGFCNYKDDRFDINLKQIKYDTLHQLYNAIQNQEFTKNLSVTCINALFHMICINIFRPISKKKNTFESIPDCSVCDKEWPHLEIIYLIFESILTSKLLNLSLIQIKSYVKKLFKLLLSPDEREQLEVCNCLAALLKNYPDSKQCIPAKTTAFLQSVLADENNQICFQSFLSFYTKNLSLLKQSNSQMFFNSFLLPLMLSNQFHLFHESFLDLMKVNLLHDPFKVNEYILYILNHWPIANFKKQTAFLEILHQMISNYNQSVTQKVLILLLKRMIKCFSDPTADISQQSMFMMEDESLIHIFWEKADSLKNELFEKLREVESSHWIENTRLFATETLDMIQKFQPKEKEKENVIDILTDDVEINNENNEMNWDVIRSMASNNYSNVNEKSKISNNENIQINSVKPTFSIKPPSQTRHCGRFIRNTVNNAA